MVVEIVEDTYVSIESCRNSSQDPILGKRDSARPRAMPGTPQTPGIQVLKIQPQKHVRKGLSATGLEPSITEAGTTHVVAALAVGDVVAMNGDQTTIL